VDPRVSTVTDALVLRAVDYREADRILTLFTQELGKVSAIARGARSSKRRFAGALEPYAVVRVELEGGKGELMTLKGAKLERVFPAILADLGRMEVAAAALLLLREAHPARVPDAPMFVSAVQYLTLVELEGDASRAALLAFTMRALALSGLAPRLDACGHSGEPVPAGKPAYFDPVRGAVIARRFGGGPFLLSSDVRERLLLARTETWVRAAREAWDAAALNTARAALSAFVSAQVPGDVGSRLFPR
jgi:DNA repair protein RecO (recombination protein O)